MKLILLFNKITAIRKYCFSTYKQQKEGKYIYIFYFFFAPQFTQISIPVIFLTACQSKFQHIIIHFLETYYVLILKYICNTKHLNFVG